jgi:hypothetical protein
VYQEHPVASYAMSCFLLPKTCRRYYVPRVDVSRVTIS